MVISNKEINSYKSKLKRMRIASGMTQSELSQLSGINIKSIAAYEQSPEKINNASVKSVYNLADCLACDIKDIIEVEFIKKRGED